MIFMNRRLIASGAMSSPGVPSAFSPPAAASACTGALAVGDGHVLHWAQAGAPDGLPALVLHGGPGSGHSPALWRFFDLTRYHVIGFDQRGCGQSTPRAGTRHNTTAHLLADIEALRRHLGLARWLVVGGSWGATLALAYACRHPGALHGLLLRGLFVPSPVELDWFFQGAQASHPEAWARFAALAPAAQRTRLLPWLAQLFAGDDTALQARATLAWRAWEHTLAGLPPPPELAGEALQRALDRCRVMVHYLAHGCWIEAQRGAPGWGEAAGLRGLPIQFLHGGQDQVCRAAPAWAVHQGLPGSRFGWVAEAGHDPYHPAMAACMAAALDGFAAHGRFPDALNAPRAPA